METNNTVYVFTTRVVSVSRRTARRYIPGTGFGDSARFHELDLGWYVHLDGSQEALYVGPEQPALAPGDLVRVAIQRLVPATPPGALALPNQAPPVA